MVSAGTVLLVEDDRDLRRLYGAALKLAGFAVRESGDGLAALRELDHPPAPDCIVLDLSLSLMSASAVRQELAASVEMRRIPVVIMTGPEEGRSQPDASCVLKKPISPEKLVATVQRCIATPPRPGQIP